MKETGRWFAIRRGGKGGKVVAWIEMFPHTSGTWMTVPGVSRFSFGQKKPRWDARPMSGEVDIEKLRALATKWPGITSGKPHELCMEPAPGFPLEPAPEMQEDPEP